MLISIFIPIIVFDYIDNNLDIYPRCTVNLLLEYVDKLFIVYRT